MLASQSTLLIRADVGPRVGTGHLMRTLALGQTWKRHGGEVTFVCGQLPRGLSKWIETEGFDHIEIQNADRSTNDAKETAEVASKIQPDWIVLDGYRFDDDYQLSVRRESTKLMVVDDYGHANHQNADLILNQNIYAASNQYSNEIRANILAGPRYVLLRSEFNFKEDDADQKKIVSEARRILVTFGGADPDNWTLKSLQVLSDLNKKRLIVDCVVGACYSHLPELEMFKKTAKMSLRIHRNVDRMSYLMSRVDLAITAGGSTCYELARCGVPAIVTSIAQNQIPITQTMNDEGVMVSIDQAEAAEGSGNPLVSIGLNDTKLRKTIRSLINDPLRRQSMSQLGKQLIDGNGADRIVRAMIAGSFSLRAAEAKDIDAMWHWRNDPEVRSVSLDQSLLPYASFAEKVNQQLADPNFQIWIAEDSTEQPIAQLTFELKQSPSSNDDQACFFKLMVDQTRRGKGLGTMLIRRACHRLFQSDFFGISANPSVVAQLMPSNAAFEKSLRSAGFTGIQPTISSGKMAIQYVLQKSPTASSIEPQRQAKKSA